MSKVKVGLAKLTFSGTFGRPEYDEGPKTMEEGGLLGLLADWGCEVVDNRYAKLCEEEEKSYGARYRLGLANNNLADIVAEQIKSDVLSIGLMANCNGLMGMLAGHQRSGHTKKPLRVGLVWIDASSHKHGSLPASYQTGKWVRATAANKIRHHGWCT